MPLQTQEEAEAIYNTDDKSYETKKACMCELVLSLSRQKT